MGVARTPSARADAHVADGLAVPQHVGGVVGIGLEVLFELGPVSAVELQVEALERTGEQVVRRLRRPGDRCQNEQTPEAACNSRVALELATMGQ